MVLITAEPLTIHGFTPYGSIIAPDESILQLDDSMKTANQGTAIKLLGVSEIEKKYPFSKTPSWNLFRCFPQPHLKRQFIDNGDERSSVAEHSIKVLEKHPFSSQTFLPMGRPSSDVSYLVVVALEDPVTETPDLSTIKAFTCKGNQAVTYGAGVWHAPMIVLGKYEHLDFGVVIYEFLDSQAPEKDCQESHYDDSAIQVRLFLA